MNFKIVSGFSAYLRAAAIIGYFSVLIHLITLVNSGECWITGVWNAYKYGAISLGRVYKGLVMTVLICGNG
jgi:hypothetical protein